VLNISNNDGNLVFAIGVNEDGGMLGISNNKGEVTSSLP